jgi:hypothetical protein
MATLAACSGSTPPARGFGGGASGKSGGAAGMRLGRRS